MVHMYLLLHVVTYMTRIDYTALLTQLISKACVVQWIECRTPESGADSSNHGIGRYFFLSIEKFTEYVQTFIYILARLSLCSQVNTCISEFDLLLSTYSKWLFNDQFRPYLVYIYIAHFHISYFPNMLIVTKLCYMYPNRYRITPLEKTLQSYFMKSQCVFIYPFA